MTTRIAATRPAGTGGPDDGEHPLEHVDRRLELSGDVERLGVREPDPRRGVEIHRGHVHVRQHPRRRPRRAVLESCRAATSALWRTGSPAPAPR